MAQCLKTKTKHSKTPRRQHRQTFSDSVHTNIFLGQSLKVLIERETKIDQWDVSNLRAFAQQRKPGQNQKDNLQNGRK